MTTVFNKKHLTSYLLSFLFSWSALSILCKVSQQHCQYLFPGIAVTNCLSSQMMVIFWWDSDSSYSRSPSPPGVYPGGHWEHRFMIPLTLGSLASLCCWDSISVCVFSTKICLLESLLAGRGQLYSRKFSQLLIYVPFSVLFFWPHKSWAGFYTEEQIQWKLQRLFLPGLEHRVLSND